jgi:hypothetical protein
MEPIGRAPKPLGVKAARYDDMNELAVW